jgi:5-formyltetrahydrofolate cyclo-ligase
MNKAELRQKYKFLRNQLTDLEVEEKSLLIANNVIKLNIWEHNYFHTFLSILESKEVNTEYLLHILQGKDKEIIVSKSDFDTKEMTHFLLTDNTKIKINTFNIPEPINGLEIHPNKIEVVFVPLLAYDQMGNRVGYGKAFYDIFLSKCNPTTIKIGVSFFEPETFINNVFPTDVKLDYCVTPSFIHAFK